MKRGYDVKWREKVVKFVLHQGRTMKEASRVFELGYETVRNWVKRYQATGKLEGEVKPVKPYKLDWEALKPDVAEHPDSYLEERAQQFGVSISTIWYALKKMGINRQKKTRRYQEPDEPEKNNYLEEVAQIEESKRVYLDECGIEPRITREYGWIERGKVLIGRVTGKRQKKVNVIAAFRQGKIIAPLLYEGTMTSQFFNHYVATCLVPVLNPGEVVILDNASFHKSPVVIELLAAQGCSRLFLPAYSPELNPIEQVWAAVKAQVRKTRSQFSSLVETLCHLFTSHPLFS